MNPPADKPSAEPASIEASKLDVLRLIGWLLVVGPLLFLAVLYVALPAQPRQAVGPLLILCLASLSLFLIGRKQELAASKLIIYGGWAAIALHALVSGGGIQTPQLAAMPLVIMLSGWLLGRGHAIAVTLLVIAFNLMLALIEQTGLVAAGQLLPPLLVWLPRAVVAVGVCLLTLFIVRTYEERIGEVRRLGEALAEERTQLRQIAENVPALIFHGDRDLRCLFANRQFADFFHGGRVPLAGMHLRDILGDTVFEGALPNVDRVLAGESVLLEGERVSKSSGQRHLEISLVPDRDGNGAIVGFYALKRDVTERQNTEQALAESEARLREAQRIGNFGSWELDLASNMFTWSDEITRIFETATPSGAVEYATFLGTVHRDDRATFDKAYRQLIAEGGSGEFSYRLPMPDGRIKVAHVRAEAKNGQDGRPIKLVGTTQDITEQVLAREEIQRLNAGLEQRVQERTAELTAANKELESFAYSISHDLRAPLRGIDGFSHLLAEEYAERLDDTGRGYLDRVRRAAQRMGELIDDILELSRVTRHSMRRENVDMSRLGHEILEELGRATPQRKVDLHVTPGCSAVGDPQLLRVLLQNLLENAWKYTGKTEAARIDFGCEKIDGETVFHVRDNGVGFDMKYAERLFSPFQRLHKPEEFEGTGIGLATVARVASRHGGRAWAEAEPDKGAVFRFTLPK